MWQSIIRPPGARGLLAAAVLAGGLFAAACGSSDKTGPTQAVANISIDPPTAPPRVMAPGTTAQLTAVATDVNGNVLSVTFTWASSDQAVVTVNSSGFVTAVAKGVATVTASAGGKSGSVAITVAVPGASIDVEPAIGFVDIGGTLQLTAKVYDADGNLLQLPATFTSQNEAIATVTTGGLVTGVAAGVVNIVATSGEITGSAQITVEAPVAQITLQPDLSAAPIAVDDTVRVSAIVTDADGQQLNRPVTWSSSNTTVATVDEYGLVTGMGAGSVTISASAGGKQGNGSLQVQPRAASVTVTRSGSGSGSLAAGSTLQLVATVLDAQGNVLSLPVQWSSSSDAIATTDQTGLVTGVAAGDAVITATCQHVSGTFALKVTGEVTETTGNNLSWPVVFADGIGVTGSPVATDPGVRPTTAETDAYAELAAVTVTNPTAEFFYSGNVADVTSGYYLQGTASAWRAQIVDGTGQSAYDASVYWGDNLASGTGNLGVDHPIRVEVAMSTTDGATLLGYSMPYVANPSSPDEIQGTDGTTVSQIPLIFSPGTTLTIDQLDGPGGSVISTFSSEPLSAEINVGGRIVYGAQFKPTVAGTYRLRFILASGANVRLTEIGNATGNITIVNPKETAIEIQVTP